MDERQETGKGAVATARRRAFLKLAGVSTVGGAAAALGGAGTAAATEAPATRGRGYRETDHVRKVYQLARF